MGPTHAVSGAVGWLLVAPVVTTVTGESMGGNEILVGAVVASGAALVPDIDMPTSTVTRAFGWPSRLLAAAVGAASASIYEATRARHDPAGGSAHRTLTHTLVFALVMGAGVDLLCSTVGDAAVGGVLFVTCGLAVRGLLAAWASGADWAVVTAVGAGVTWVIHLFVTVESHWMLGIAVGFGCIVHLIGDMITLEACPLLWPLRIRGRRWRPIGPPRILRIRAGGKFEKRVLLPGLTILNAALAWTTWGEEIAGRLFGDGWA